MKLRTVGRTSLQLTELGFGAAPIGNLFRSVPHEDAIRAVEAAWDLGVRYFDAAPYYGLGLAEDRLGEALESKPSSSYVISTKVGRRLVEEDATTVNGLVDGQWAVSGNVSAVRDYSKDGIRTTLDSSLRRLRRDHVDIVYVHDPDDYLDQTVRETIPTLAALRDQGIISAVGIGTSSWSTAMVLVERADVDVVMIAGRWTLADRSALPLLHRCEQLGKSIVAAGVLNSGLLARAWPPDDARFEYAPAPTQMLELARQMAATCKDFGVTLPDAAIQFPLRSDSVSSVVVGMATSLEVKRDVAHFSAHVPACVWADLE